MPLWECQSIYSTNEKISSATRISEDQYCAYDPNNKTDACTGDSGGPLQLMDNNSRTAEIVGITSFGSNCDVRDVPGIYTRVAQYIHWIEEIVWPDLSEKLILT